jgi:hypothetical protein
VGPKPDLEIGVKNSNQNMTGRKKTISIHCVIKDKKEKCINRDEYSFNKHVLCMKPKLRQTVSQHWIDG